MKCRQCGTGFALVDELCGPCWAAVVEDETRQNTIAAMETALVAQANHLWTANGGRMFVKPLEAGAAWVVVCTPDQMALLWVQAEGRGRSTERGAGSEKEEGLC